MVTDVIVVGGGPAGMMAAVAARESGAEVLLIEKNEKLGKKLFITGHGRCNVTNAADRDTYERKIFRNPRFMRSALSRFTPDDMIEFLQQQHVPVKQEDSGRIFPASDKSSDVIRAFNRKLDSLGTAIELNIEVKAVNCDDDGLFTIATSRGNRRSRSVVLATGGLSYPSTGATGEGFKFAESLGHSCSSLHSGLAGLVCEDSPSDLAGLTVRGGRIVIRRDGRTIAQEDGDILFTHYGLSGPAVFRAVCALADSIGGRLEAAINLAGCTDEENLVSDLTDAVAANGRDDIKTIVANVIPRRAVKHVLDAAEVSPRKKANQLTNAERARIAHSIAFFPMKIIGPRPIEEAIITIGGVNTKEITPSTMESRIVPGLFFAGEVIDVSAYTGGYNLQVAFSTGRAAGIAAAGYALEHQSVQNPSNDDTMKRELR